MSEKPISDLRRRMLEDVAVRKFDSRTCHNYIRHVALFAKFLGRSPDVSMGAELSANVGFQFSLVWRGEDCIGDQPLS
jgi:hypothetical protein